MTDGGNEIGGIQDLIRYRMEQAGETLQEGQTLLDAGQLRGSVNRAYYSMFYIAQALLTHGGLGTSKHSGALALFDREYVKTGIFRKELSEGLHKLFDTRQVSDYGKEKVVITAKEARHYLMLAESFVAEIKKYLEDKLKTADPD